MTGDALHLSRELADEMVDHCISERPNEACGLLGLADGRIVKVFRMTNASASPVRYSLDATEQLAAYKKLDEEEWDLGGIFHSHTHTEAYPSPTDVREAHEDVPYVIVSLAYQPPDIRAFRITKDNWRDENGTVEEIPVVVD